MRKNATLEKKMDDAIITLSKTFDPAANAKPVILHSVRVGLCLYNHGYDEDIVLSGILHDILEDTYTTHKHVEDEYGKTVADIVNAVSFNRAIRDKIEQNEDMLLRCKQYGHKALIVKCADMIDNMPFTAMVDNKKQDVLQDVLGIKYSSFKNHAAEIVDEPIFRVYMDMYDDYFI